MTNYKDMSNEKLLELYEMVVKIWHYDPGGSMEEYKHDSDELKALILERMTNERK